MSPKAKTQAFEVTEYAEGGGEEAICPNCRSLNAKVGDQYPDVCGTCSVELTYETA